MGPPQAANFGVFWAFLRGKRFKNSVILGKKSEEAKKPTRSTPPLVFGQIGREGGGVDRFDMAHWCKTFGYILRLQAIDIAFKIYPTPSNISYAFKNRLQAISYAFKTYPTAISS